MPFWKWLLCLLGGLIVFMVLYILASAGVNAIPIRWAQLPAAVFAGFCRDQNVTDIDRRCLITGRLSGHQVDIKYILALYKQRISDLGFAAESSGLVLH